MSALNSEATSESQMLDRCSPPGFERVCEQTLAFCAERGIVPIPPIYELVFAYFEGSREDVVQELDEAIGRGETESFQFVELHDKLLGRTELAVAFDAIGTTLGHEIGSLERIASNGQEDAIRSRGELTRLVSGMRSATNNLTNVSTVANRMRDLVLQQARNVSDMKEGLDEAKGRLHKIERELEGYVRQANTDYLTGLPNRRALDSKISSLMQKPYNPEICDCILMIDIDWFKKINDTHGHDVGDNVLRQFSSLLLHECESVEAYAGRWGGEEFCVVHSAKSRESCSAFAEIIRTKVEGLSWKRMSDGVDMGQITVSIGIAQRDEAADVASLVRDADKALYAAKDEGRNLCKQFEDV
ncbi:MAG: GGDEF domain-containing protein [Pseudomonadota bacterium]